jgi:hypothetical protein
VQELKEQLETHLLAVDLVSHTQHSKSFSKKEKMKKKTKRAVLVMAKHLLPPVDQPTQVLCLIRLTFT